MTNIFLTVVITLFSAEPDKILHTKCLYPTVMVKSSRTLGTGVVIRSDKFAEQEYRNVVISCGHVVNNQGRDKHEIGVGMYENWSEFQGFEIYPAYVYWVDNSLDISVLLFISEKKLPVADLDFDAKIYIGTDCSRIGCGLNQQFRLDIGKITSVNIDISNTITNIYRTSIPSVGGDSGGPLFVDNKVVGLMSAVQYTPGRFYKFPVYHLSYCVPIRFFKETKSDNISMDFVIDKTKELPSLPFFTLQVQQMVEEEFKDQ